MSLYAEYIRERTTDSVIESDYGFATYRYLDDGQTVYIVDIFVLEAHRKSHCAALMADRIAHEAKKRGAIQMLGTVQPSAKGSTTGLAVLLAYGFKLFKAGDDHIIMRKDL